MYGWRGRIGFISPPLMTELVPYEFYQMVPEGVGLLVTCMGLDDLTPEQMTQALGAIERHIREQNRREVDYIVLGGTPLILSRGAGFESELLARVQPLSRVPVTTTTHAALAALRSLRVKRLVSLTTYHPWRNDLLSGFLTAQGFEVLTAKGFSSHIADIHKIAPETVYREAKKLYVEYPEAQAIYIPCAQLHTWPVVGLIERECGVPVVTSTLAWVWSALQALNISAPAHAESKLLASTVKDSPART
jgi:maleate cis-trans isomerase